MDAEKLMMQKQIDNLRERLKIVARERRVLMADLRAIAHVSLAACLVCKYSPGEGRNCPRCGDSLDCFEWRGPCAENGGAAE